MTRPGLLVIDKPGGMTSHDVVARVRRILGTRKVGHAGTLDPMATGLLIVGVERATRLLGHLALHDKRYEATIRLGSTTVTDDSEGEVLTTADPADVQSVDASMVRAAGARLVGALEQRPSSVSAIKVEGRRAYDRVRAGEEVQLATRAVVVTRFDVLDVRPGPDALDVDVDVECSTGTYVRALARDLGADLGIGGHLTRLRRTRVGSFSVDQALDLDRLGELGEAALIPLADVAPRCFPTWQLDDEQTRCVSYGQRIAWSGPAGEPGVVALMAADGDLCALGVDDDGLSRYLAVFA